MRQESRLIKLYGKDEYGFADLPRKVSGTKISRAFHGRDMGCTWCFPHGIELSNNKWSKVQRSWKKYRKTQYKGVYFIYFLGTHLRWSWDWDGTL